MVEVDCITTDLLCMRVCGSALNTASVTRVRCKAEVGLFIWSSQTDGPTGEQPGRDVRPRAVATRGGRSAGRDVAVPLRQWTTPDCSADRHGRPHQSGPYQLGQMHHSGGTAYSRAYGN